MVRQLVPLSDVEEPIFKLPAEGLVTIGRRPTCSIVCKDISVSAKHCEVIVLGGSSKELLVLVDCSSNGSYINDVRVAKGDRAQLHDGDIISLSKPHPAGTNDGTVDPPPTRVQYRLDFRPGRESPATDMPEDAASPIPLSMPTAPPRRAATTAEGFAQDLLVQEQLCKARITGELLLARRKLDEERMQSESLARDLRKSKATLEEERNKRTAAQASKDSFRSELSKLKDSKQKLQETQAAHASLQEKHEGIEIELMTQAQKATSLEAVVERLQEELRGAQVGNLSANEQLTAAQERLRSTQDEVSRLEGLVAEARSAAGNAQKESDRLQRELAAERSKKESLEDQQVLVSGEIERAERGGSSSKDLLIQAKKEIGDLELKISRSRREADAESTSSSQAKTQHDTVLKCIDQLKEASVRFADALHGCVDRWTHGLPELSLPRVYAQPTPARATSAQVAHAGNIHPVTTPTPATKVKSSNESAGKARGIQAVATTATSPAPVIGEGADGVLPRVGAAADDGRVESTSPTAARDALDADALISNSSEACSKEGDGIPIKGGDHEAQQGNDSAQAMAMLPQLPPLVAAAELAAAPPLPPPAFPPPQRMWSVCLLGGTAGEVQESYVGFDEDESLSRKRRKVLSPS